MIRRTALALALLAAASAALASSAPAAGWLPRAAIDPAPGGGLVDRAGSIAFDDQGNATAIWLRGDTGHTTNALFVARRPRGGAWGGVEQLSSTSKV
ncbi:MAG: hypothetical protein QOH89_1573, partial [Pseudonocardiales bacterium]|nr:hypothetical protein [Pseudonocardiales bacterium]